MFRLVVDLFGPVYRLVNQPNLFTFYKLCFCYEKARRFYQFYNISFNGLVVSIADGPSFVWQYKDIFVDECYCFYSTSSSPVIYDCGANIGLSTLYFGRNYPGAKIVAFEPDNKIFRLLQSNVESNKLLNVSMINKAAWIHDDGVGFFSEGADGGSISQHSDEIVESVRLRDFLLAEDKIDLLKIDIEGAETDVILDCTDQLYKVDNVFIEYHSFRNSPQKLSKLLGALEGQGFRYLLQSTSKINKPFIKKNDLMPMDLQLNIYGYRC